MEVAIIKNIATALSTLTIMSCLFIKVPQIIYIREKQSAEGIVIKAMLMELFGFSLVTLYNFTNNYSVMTYLEYPIILLQVYVLMYYVLKYKQLLACSMVPIAAILYTCVVIGFIAGALPKTILSYMVPLSTPLSGFAKVTYIYGIISEKNADAISLTTWIISVLTNIARIFTVYVDSGDKTLLINFLISTVLSLGVLGSACYYKKFCPKLTVPQRTQHKARGRKHSHSD